MWKPKLENSNTGQRRGGGAGGAMAHRRAVGSRKLAGVICGLVLLAVMMAGSVYVSNRVTGLRAEIATLETQRGFLEASSAQLMTAWNKATARSVITARAERELGLITPQEPDLALVETPAVDNRVSPWRRLLANMSGADAAEAAPLPQDAGDSLVSLVPRPAVRRGDG